MWPHPAVAGWPGWKLGSIDWTLVRAALDHAQRRTGLPKVLLAALTLTLLWRVLKRMTKYAVEVVAVTALLAVASELGWMRWLR